MAKSVMGLRKTFLQLLIVVLVLAVAFVIFKGLSSMRKPPVRKPREVYAPLLQGVTASAEQVQMVVRGFGTVEAKVRVEIVPEVSGRVVEIATNFVNGGFFNADETLIKIEGKDYELAVESARAAVAQAQIKVEQELSEAEVAKNEWKLIHPDIEPESVLVYREPQIKGAQAQLAAAESMLKRVELDLSRTKISMPFAGRVISESVDAGQYLAVGRGVGTVYGTDVAEITVPFEDSQLAWFDICLAGNSNARQSNSQEVTVTSDFGGARYSWVGKVARTAGQIDSASRTIGVVIEVIEPFKLSLNRPPLMPGMFVEVTIKGKILDDIFKLSRHVIHNGDEIWVANDGKLNIRKVQVLRFDEDNVYIVSGLDDGEVVILSPLDAISDGMAIMVELVDSARDEEGVGK